MKRVAKKRVSRKCVNRVPLPTLFRDHLTFLIVIVLLGLTTTIVLLNPPLKLNFYKGTSVVYASSPTAPYNPNFSSMSNVNFEENYDYTVNPQVLGTVRVPILMYHHIAPLPNFPTRGLYVSPETFEKQMAYLSAKNYKTLSPGEFYNLLVSGKNPIQKSILLTFDDGSPDNYTAAFPMLKKYRLKGTFFVSSSKLGITPGQLREMSAAGMSIESHTENHIDLQKEANYYVLTQEILGSKNNIESITGIGVTSIAYPGCVTSSQSIGIVAISGYLMGFSCGKSIDHWFSHRYSLSRVHVFDDMENFKKLLSGIWEVPAGYSNY